MHNAHIVIIYTTTNRTTTLIGLSENMDVCHMKIYAIKPIQQKSLQGKNWKKSYVNIHLTISRGLVIIIDKGTTNVHKSGSGKTKANKLMR